MKRAIIGFLLAACTVMSVSAAGAREKAAVNIGFIQIIDNLTFKEMRDGFYERMAEKGYGPERAAITYKDAQGDMGTLNTICQEFANGNYDVVVTLATPPTQAFGNLQSGKPQIFIAVADPLAAKIVSSMERPDRNATGTSDYIPVDAVFALADKLTPGIRRYGFIYNFGEVNAVSTIKNAKSYLDKQGVTYQEVTVSGASEVQQAALSLAGRVDAIFIPDDSLVVSAMPQIVEAATAAKIPVYGTALVHVVGGSLATVGIDDRLIGQRSADMVIDVLNGKKIADTPVVTFDTLNTVINRDTARKLGVTIGPEFAGVMFVGE
jgi:putative ABC transport system substrate-binding protein